jgi:pimeloyl-ACP methyl ester carboxylesterase
MPQTHIEETGGIEIGAVYRHFKGNLYKVIEIARHSETGLPMVVYQALYGDFGFWVRPLGMFLETVDMDGRPIRRFERVEDPAPTDPCEKLFSDPQAGLDPAPGMAQLILKQGGDRLFGIMLTPGGAGPHPTLLLLHGFPGNERNFDLAHGIRRLGWNVMVFHFRGTWGSEGVFSFQNALEDTEMAIRFLRSEEARRSYQVDPGQLYIAGNSFGAFAALLAAQQDAGLKGCIALSTYDLGMLGNRLDLDEKAKKDMVAMFEDCVIPTAGARVDALTREVSDNRHTWDLARHAGSFKDRPVMLLAGTQDTDGPPEDHYMPLKKAFEAAGARLEAHLLESDHGFQNKRVEVACLMGRFLEKCRQC